jgi:hypothetical protein
MGVGLYTSRLESSQINKCKVFSIPIVAFVTYCVVEIWKSYPIDPITSEDPLIMTESMGPKPDAIFKKKAIEDTRPNCTSASLVSADPVAIVSVPPMVIDSDVWLESSTVTSETNPPADTVNPCPTFDSFGNLTNVTLPFRFRYTAPLTYKVT